MHKRMHILCFLITRNNQPYILYSLNNNNMNNYSQNELLLS